MAQSDTRTERFQHHRKEKLDRRSTELSQVMRRQRESGEGRVDVKSTELFRLSAQVLPQYQFDSSHFTEVSAVISKSTDRRSSMEGLSKPALILLFLLLSLSLLASDQTKASDYPQDAFIAPPKIENEKRLEIKQPLNINALIILKLRLPFESITLDDPEYSYSDINKLNSSRYDDLGYINEALVLPEQEDVNIHANDLRNTFCFPAAVWTYHTATRLGGSVSLRFLYDVQNQFSREVALQADKGYGNPHTVNIPSVGPDGESTDHSYSIRTVRGNVAFGLEPGEARMIVIRPKDQSKVGHWLTLIANEVDDQLTYTLWQSAPRSYIDLQRHPYREDREEGGTFRMDFNSAQDLQSYLTMLGDFLSGTQDSRSSKDHSPHFRIFSVTSVGEEE